MYIYIYIYTYIHAYIYIHIHIHIYDYIHIYTYWWVCTHQNPAVPAPVPPPPPPPPLTPTHYSLHAPGWRSRVVCGVPHLRSNTTPKPNHDAIPLSGEHIALFFWTSYVVFKCSTQKRMHNNNSFLFVDYRTFLVFSAARCIGKCSKLRGTLQHTTRMRMSVALF
jgi:hypothetical protein